MPCKSDNRAALRNSVVDAAIREATGTDVAIVAGDLTISPDPSSGCPANGTAIRVTVRHNYTTILGGFVGFDTLPISASTSMVFYGTDGDQGDY